MRTNLASAYHQPAEIQLESGCHFLIPVTLPAPPRLKSRPRDYAPLVQKLDQNEGTWFSVALDTVAGNTIPRKRQALCQVARLRGVRLQTSIQVGGLYVRAIPHDAVEGVSRG